MDGNLRNNGVLTLPSPSSNTITYTDGKTCNRCGTGQLIYHFTDDPIPSSSNYSIAMWVSVVSDFPSGNIILYSKNTSEYTNCQSYFSIYGTGTQLRFFTHNGQEILANYTFSKNIWYHVACTRNGNTIRMYVNGSLIKTQACTITSISSLNMCIGCRSGNASGTNVVGSASMKYNDIRIYDECISDDEVYRLSKGLVLHYPMTGGLHTGENILIGTMRKEFTTTSQSRPLGVLCCGSGGNGTFSVTDADEVPSGTLSWNITGNTTGNRDFQQAPIPYVSGNVYTASWWSKGNGTQKFRVWDLTASNALIEKTWSLTSSWKYYTYTFTATSTMATDSCTWHLGVSGNSNINMCGLKLELGDKATPWGPNAEDLIYSPLGYSISKEYDVSGHEYDGTKVGTFSYSTDTPMFNVSTTGDGSSYIEVASPTDQIRSVSFWINTPKTVAKVAWADYKSCLAFGVGTAGNILCSCRSNSYIYPGSVLTANVWQHIVLIRDDSFSTVDLYINGVKQTKGSNADNWTHGTDTTMIFGRSYSTNPARMICKMSDFRMYATQLTQDDITKLYNHASDL